jgi:hypothetical protein
MFFSIFRTSLCANRSYSWMDASLLERGTTTRRWRVEKVGGAHSRVRRKLLGVASRWKHSCEAESPRSGFSVEVLVRGGNSSEGLLGGTPPRVFSCEAKGTGVRRKEVVRTSYTEKLLRNGKTTVTSKELQHRLLAALIWTKPFRATRWVAAIRD